MNPEDKSIEVETFNSPNTGESAPSGDPKPDMNEKMKKPKISDYK